MHVNESAALIFKKIFFYLFIVGTWLFALQAVNIPLTLFAFLGGAVAVAVGFGAQNLLNNFISGLIILMERPFKLNDVVEIDGKIGRVVNIGARCSLLQLPTGVELLVPNSSFLEKNVLNWTHADKKVRASVRVSVAYGTSVAEVSKLLKQAAEADEGILKQPAPMVLLANFGDNALEFDLQFWAAVGVDTVELQRLASAVRFRIDELFQKAGVAMSFPQRDIHLSAAGPIPVQVIP
jgi:small-conductance mechanosensitive channel